MNYRYKTSGVCSRTISFDLDDDNTVRNVHFDGGCNGNTQGVSTLAEGMKAEDLIEKLSGIRCGFKNTSCPDQLSKAIKSALESR